MTWARTRPSKLSSKRFVRNINNWPWFTCTHVVGKSHIDHSAGGPWVVCCVSVHAWSNEPIGLYRPTIIYSQTKIGYDTSLQYNLHWHNAKPRPLATATWTYQQTHTHTYIHSLLTIYPADVRVACDRTLHDNERVLPYSIQRRRKATDINCNSIMAANSQNHRTQLQHNINIVVSLSTVTADCLPCEPLAGCIRPTVPQHSINNCCFLRTVVDWFYFYCLPNAIHCMGQNIKSLAVCAFLSFCVFVRMGFGVWLSWKWLEIQARLQ